ncbi:WD40 repeat - like 10, partial [Theobroma cacao]
ILIGHNNEVWFIQFSNNGEYLAFSSSDCTAIIWKIMDNGKLTMKHILRSYQNLVFFVAWSPNDTKLLTCGNMEVLKLWDVETGTCKHTFRDHGFTISSCA